VPFTPVGAFGFTIGTVVVVVEVVAGVVVVVVVVEVVEVVVVVGVVAGAVQTTPNGSTPSATKVNVLSQYFTTAPLSVHAYPSL
jgi:hypothetical protein